MAKRLTKAQLRAMTADRHCPTCHAKPGEPCMSIRTGLEFGMPHLTRFPRTRFGVLVEEGVTA